MTDFFDKLIEQEPYTQYTLDMFSRSAGKDHAEIDQFDKWRQMVTGANKYTFEVPHLGANFQRSRYAEKAAMSIILSAFPATIISAIPTIPR